MKTLGIHDNHLGRFFTVSGVEFDLHEPRVDMIQLEDITTGLGNYCRYGGQIERFYSVAQHSILVAMLAPEQYRREALLHDASEAYVGDVIKPLKNLLGKSYAIYEAVIMELVCQRFNLNQDNLDKVKSWDIMALELEHSALRLKKPQSIRAWNELWAEYSYDGRCWMPRMSSDRLNQWFLENNII